MQLKSLIQLYISMPLSKCSDCNSSLFRSENRYGCSCSRGQHFCSKCSHKKHKKCADCHQQLCIIRDECYLCGKFQLNSLLLTINEGAVYHFCYECLKKKYSQQPHQKDVNIGFYQKINRFKLYTWLKTFCSKCHRLLPHSPSSNSHLNSSQIEILPLQLNLCSRCQMEKNKELIRRSQIDKKKQYEQISAKERSPGKNIFSEKKEVEQKELNKPDKCIICNFGLYGKGVDIGQGNYLCGTCWYSYKRQEQKQQRMKEHQKQINRRKAERLLENSQMSQSKRKYVPKEQTKVCSSCERRTYYFKEIVEGMYICNYCEKANESAMKEQQYRKSRRCQSNSPKADPQYQRDEVPKNSHKQSSQQKQNEPEIIQDEQLNEKRSGQLPKNSQVIMEPIDPQEIFQKKQQDKRDLTKNRKDDMKLVEEKFQQLGSLKQGQGVHDFSSTNADSRYLVEANQEVFQPTFYNSQIYYSQQKNEDPFKKKQIEGKSKLKEEAIVLNVPLEYPEANDEDIVTCKLCKLQLQVKYTFWNQEVQKNELDPQENDMPIYCRQCFAPFSNYFMERIKREKKFEQRRAQNSKAMKPMENAIDDITIDSTLNKYNRKIKIKYIGKQEAELLKQQKERQEKSIREQEFKENKPEFDPLRSSPTKQKNFIKSPLNINLSSPSQPILSPRNPDLSPNTNPQTSKSNIYSQLNPKNLSHAKEDLRPPSKQKDKKADEFRSQKKSSNTREYKEKDGTEVKQTQSRYSFEEKTKKQSSEYDSNLNKYSRKSVNVESEHRSSSSVRKSRIINNRGQREDSRDDIMCDFCFKKGVMLLKQRSGKKICMDCNMLLMETP